MYEIDERLDKFVESVTKWGKFINEIPESKKAAKVFLAMQCEIYLREYCGGWFQTIVFILRGRWNLQWHPRWLFQKIWFWWIEKQGKVEWRIPYSDIPEMRERHRIGCVKTLEEEVECSCIEEIEPRWLQRMF